MAKTAEAILPAFLIMGLGWFLRRRGVLTEELASGLNKMAFVIMMPLLLFQKIGSQPLGEVFSGALISGTLLSFGAIWLMTLAIVKLVRRVRPERRGVIVQGSFRPNTAVVGLAVLSGAWGNAVFAPAGMLLGALVPFMNFLSVLALLLPHRYQKGLKGFGAMAMALAGNPLIIGAILGAARSASGMHPPVAINSALDMLADMAIPVALLGAGGSLNLEKIRGDFKATLGTTFIKLIIMPALTWLILAGMFDVGGMLLGIGVIFAAAPTAMVSYIMADQMKGDSELAASILVLTHLVSIVTMGLWLAALFRWS